MSGKKLNQNEQGAVLKGGKLAGAYLEQIGVFDLRNMSPEQWSTFCGKIYQGACDELRRQADDEVPF